MVDMFEKEYGRYAIVETDAAYQPTTPKTTETAIASTQNASTERDVETAFKEIIAEAATTERSYTSITERSDVREALARIALIQERKRASAQ